jgi:hypothetical protein
MRLIRRKASYSSVQKINSSIKPNPSFFNAAG